MVDYWVDDMVQFEKFYTFSRRIMEPITSKTAQIGTDAGSFNRNFKYYRAKLIFEKVNATEFGDYESLLTGCDPNLRTRFSLEFRKCQLSGRFPWKQLLNVFNDFNTFNFIECRFQEALPNFGQGLYSSGGLSFKAKRMRLDLMQK